MTQPDYQHGYLRIPLALWLAVFCGGLLTRRQLQLVAVVIRQSWGWRLRSGEVQNWTRPLSSREFARATGLSTDHLQRDLDDLRARGVLRVDLRRYQFVADFRRWKTPPPRARQTRRAALFVPPASGNSALLPPGVKKPKKEKENEVGAPGRELSPTEDNSSSFAVEAYASRPVTTAPLVARFVAIVAAFTGPLSPLQAGVLRRRLGARSLAAVWRALEPGFRGDQKAAQRHLTKWLAGGPE